MFHSPLSPAEEPLDSRRLQQFLCVAEHSGFSRAAERLHLSQQALSSSVAKLEAQLGVSLFDRTGRQVRLTPAGEALRDGASVLLAAGQTLARQVRDAAAAQRRPFVVAHTPAVTAEEVHGLLEPVRRGMPDVSVTAVQIFPSDLESAVVCGTVDLALRRGTTVPATLAAAVIAYHPLRVAVAHGHRLAGHRTVALRELRDERFVVWAPPGTSFYTDFILSTCRRAGFEPALVVNRIQGTTPATAVLDYPDAVAFVTAPPGAALGGAVTVIDIEDPPLAPVQAVWLPHTRSTIRDLLTTGDNPRTPSANNQ
ncbi:DNA-binding transcriptional LysR family regulator [Nocardia transvalensis]|uniref:DNA-binding transcriptional LysR family regulator n=1 Tax=Nocardia transvalensis TaxID=37333 RepID=A0A7W9PFN6_9NOCA|nr:LysR family transcriptional regulator [Nocardia transvalensis]MBB5915215.1 DNA-binding transcriptional LysR family regulator [Nocardia transvalensis]